MRASISASSDRRASFGRAPRGELAGEDLRWEILAIATARDASQHDGPFR